MATSRRLSLTRDQLATFLGDQEQIRQFELLFSVIDELQSTSYQYQADTAAANANNALAQINALAQDTKVDDAVLNAKVQQVLDAIPRLTQALELLALAPVRNNIQLQHDVNGVLQVKNGGTGQSTFTDGELLIGNSTGNTLTKAVLTAGTNITITNGPGSITIAAAGVSGASGSFTTVDSKTVTVVNGIITSIV
jgi:hypothetical protein